MRGSETPFVSLADVVLREPNRAAVATGAQVDERPTHAIVASNEPEQCRSSEPGDDTAPDTRSAPLAASSEHDAAIRSARLFRAALQDAVVALVPEVIHVLATQVLGRELHLQPVDITAIAQRIIAERLTLEPVRLRVAPADVAVACTLPVITDPALAAGDAVLECHSGSIDARLAVRLATAIDGIVR